jgi:phi13 family phage major tail protein
MAKVGISKLHYAIVSTEDTPTSNPVYGTVKTPSVGLINVDVSVESNSVSLYADNMIWETEQSSSNINLTANIADFPLDMQADILGHTYSSSDKTLIKKSSDVAPYIALGFEFLMANGKKLACWLYKGKMSESNLTGSTKGENTEYQTNDISGTFAALKGSGDNTGRWLYCQEFDATENTDSFYASVPLAT